MNSREHIGSYPFELGLHGSEDPTWTRFCIVTSVLTAMQTVVESVRLASLWIDSLPNCIGGKGIWSMHQAENSHLQQRYHWLLKFVCGTFKKRQQPQNKSDLTKKTPSNIKCLRWIIFISHVKTFPKVVYYKLTSNNYDTLVVKFSLKCNWKKSGPLRGPNLTTTQPMFSLFILFTFTSCTSDPPTFCTATLRPPTHCALFSRPRQREALWEKLADSFGLGSKMVALRQTETGSRVTAVNGLLTNVGLR